MFDEMVPWERDAYVAMLVAKVEADNERAKLENQARRAAAKTTKPPRVGRRRR